MLKYGFSNLRRLRNVTPVELRPITLLVGRNSSGKSTFLRTFPLFRQSINTRTSSPILWYGDLVDFGSFNVAVSSATKSDPIVFSFDIGDLPISSANTFSYLAQSSLQKRVVRGVSAQIFIVPFNDRTRISRIKIKVESISLDVDMSFDTSNRVSSVLLNGVESINDLKPAIAVLTTGALFPDLRLLAQATETSRTDRSSLYWLSEQSHFHDAAFRLLRGPLDARIANKTLDSLVTLLFDNLTLTKNTLRNYEKLVSSPRFKGFVREVSSTDANEIFQRLSNYITLAAMPRLLNSLSSQLRGLFGSTLYIGPARARSERYYRYQDLAVSEIDPDGKNFPMFLNSLTRKQRSNLSDWIENLYGYGITIAQESGHISIRLVEGESESNIVDVGYGVSQILPVLGQIWWARARRAASKKSDLNLIAIEQPELHLHPAHQALLADALVGETKQSSSSDGPEERVSFLIETHSETLVNRLGNLISEKKIAAEDVQILLFEPNEEDSMYTDVRSVKFDTEGVLIDWPYGFFQPEI